jgi:protein-disulfide isomerase
VSSLNRPIEKEDHVQGSASAPITVVEYGDYECPFCGAAYPMLKELQKQLGNKMRFVFRNFPLTNVHPYAELAAEAAEAAGAQGKFWEMHDGIYENQESLGEELILELAKTIGLDIKKFREDLEKHKFAERVKKDFMGGVRSGVNGTPGIFLNGIQYPGALDKMNVLRFLKQRESKDESARL